LGARQGRADATATAVAERLTEFLSVILSLRNQFD
jgi:hypothetical protein